jgi:hypothetical protein
LPLPFSAQILLILERLTLAPLSSHPAVPLAAAAVLGLLRRFERVGGAMTILASTQPQAGGVQTFSAPVSGADPFVDGIAKRLKGILQV